MIPIFTENIREAFETVSIGDDFMKALYGMTKGMMTPMMIATYQVKGGGVGRAALDRLKLMM